MDSMGNSLAEKNDEIARLAAIVKTLKDENEKRQKEEASLLSEIAAKNTKMDDSDKAWADLIEEKRKLDDSYEKAKETIVK